MADPQDFTDDELLKVYKNPKADLSKLSRSELQRLDTLTSAPQKTVPTATAADMLSHYGGTGANTPEGDTGYSEPDTYRGGFLRTILGSDKPQESAVYRTAYPSTVGDVLPLLLPSGGDAWIRDAAGRVKAAVKAAAQETGSAKDVATFLPRTYGNFVDALGSSNEAAIEKFRGPRSGVLRTQPAGELLPTPPSPGLPVAAPIEPVVPPPSPAPGVLRTQRAPDLYERMRGEGVRFDTPGAGATLKPVKVPPTPAEQMGLSPTATGNVMESLPETPVPAAARVAEPPTVQIRDVQKARDAEAAAEGANVRDTPSDNTPRDLTAEEQAAQAATNEAEATARRQEMMQELGVAEKPPLQVEAPAPPPDAVSGSARERISVPVKSEPPPVPPAARPNTLVRSKDLGQILRDVQEQLASEPVTTASGLPSEVKAAGEAARTSGRPPLTPTEYENLQASIPENAPRTADLDKADVAARKGYASELEPTAAPDEAEATGVPEEPEGEGTIPSREQMGADELSRAREGARDSPDRQPGETVEDYRLRTRSRVTGEQSADPSIIPSRRAAAIDDKIDSMYARNATDQEFRDYLAKSANHPNNREIAAKIESKAHSWKRASPLAHVVAGAVAGGAALRNALVNQLQGDQKDQEQD